MSRLCRSARCLVRATGARGCLAEDSDRDTRPISEHRFAGVGRADGIAPTEVAASCRGAFGSGCELLRSRYSGLSYPLSGGGWRQIWHRRSRFPLLSDWFGSTYFSRSAAWIRSRRPTTRENLDGCHASARSRELQRAKSCLSPQHQPPRNLSDDIARLGNFVCSPAGRQDAYSAKP